MSKTLLAMTLSLACSGAAAANWPWQQDSTPKESNDYCMGLVVGGLASNKVSGMSRTELWQAWSYLIRSGALRQPAAAKEYQAGLERFQNAADIAAADATLQEAMGSCGLGRTGRQITGW